MELDPQRVIDNARRSGTRDLLNRVTVYRAGMEPAAVFLIEEELYARGIERDQIEEHDRRLREEVIFLPEGFAARCSHCDEPALASGWGMHFLFGIFPLLPRYFYYCLDHMPEEQRRKVLAGRDLEEVKRKVYGAEPDQAEDGLTDLERGRSW